MRLRGCTLLLIALYLDDTIGLSGPNLVKLAQLVAYLKLRGLEYAIVGDFNMEPQQLAQDGWLEQIGGFIVTPEGATWTCKNGLRLIDFAVMSRGARAMLLSFTIDHLVPWGTHLATRLAFARKPRELLMRSVVAPQAIDVQAIKDNIKEGASLPRWQDVRSKAALAPTISNDDCMYIGLVEQAPFSSSSLPSSRMLSEHFKSWSAAAESWLAEAARQPAEDDSHPPPLSLKQAVRGAPPCYRGATGRARKGP